ncbi:MAG: hypothetical protein JWR19_4322 [Pedosphaera sp.]|nr:hypothetical protein [Pedosphaera sp.]
MNITALFDYYYSQRRHELLFGHDATTKPIPDLPPLSTSETLRSRRALRSLLGSHQKLPLPPAVHYPKVPPPIRPSL